MIAVWVAVGLFAWTAATFASVRVTERACGEHRIPSPLPAIGLAIALALSALALHPPLVAALVGATCIALVAAAGADARTGYLFDSVTLPAAIVAIALAIAGDRTSDAALAVFFVVGTFGGIVAFSRGRMMGLGDVKALYTIAVAFGPLESAIAIFAACVSGICAAGIGSRLRRGLEIRFGPHLAVGAAFTLVAGDAIVHRVLGI